MPDSPVQVRPISDGDLPEVGRFLGENFPPDTGPDQWAQAWRQSVNLPDSGAPNHGMLLRAGGVVVGAYPAVYSTRVIDGRQERFCNLAVWYVDPAYRFHAIRMLRALLDQPGWHFTDLTPIPGVQKLNARLGFNYLNTDTALVPNLPWPTRPGRIRVYDRAAEIEAVLTGADLRYYRDHLRCQRLRHLVLDGGGGSCYLQWRIERRKDLPWFASIHYASKPELLRHGFRRLSRYLLLRHRMPFSLIELRVAGGRVWPSLLLPSHRRRMYRSDTLPSDKIDYLYSELSIVP
jgi:hypothetical protein